MWGPSSAQAADLRSLRSCTPEPGSFGNLNQLVLFDVNHNYWLDVGRRFQLAKTKKSRSERAPKALDFFLDGGLNFRPPSLPSKLFPRYVWLKMISATP